MMRTREPSSMAQRLQAIAQAYPPDFGVPERFDRILRMEEPPDIDPWWWLFEFHTSLDFWAATIKRQFPARPPLVPFAKHGFTDDVFCFDGTDTTGNPRVYIVHTYTSPGYEDRGYWDDFDTFMEEAEEVHAEWVRDEEEFARQQLEGHTDDQ